MPRGRYNRRPRGPYRKRKGKAKAMMKYKIARAITSGIDQCKMVKLTYAVQVLLDPETFVQPTKILSANSLYAPEYSATGTVGHQPLYYDEYSQLYANYKVFGSKITITGANSPRNPSDTMGNLIVCKLQSTTDSVGSYTEVIEAKSSKYRQCQQNRPFRLSHKYSAKKFHCIDDVKDNIELQGLTGNFGTGSSPQQPAYYHITAFPLYQGQDSQPASLNIRVDYIAMFYNVKKMQGS